MKLTSPFVLFFTELSQQLDKRILVKVNRTEFYLGRQTLTNEFPRCRSYAFFRRAFGVSFIFNHRTIQIRGVTYLILLT